MLHLSTIRVSVTARELRILKCDAFLSIADTTFAKMVKNGEQFCIRFNFC